MEEAFLKTSNFYLFYCYKKGNWQQGNRHRSLHYKNQSFFNFLTKYYSILNRTELNTLSVTDNFCYQIIFYGQCWWSVNGRLINLYQNLFYEVWNQNSQAALTMICTHTLTHIDTDTDRHTQTRLREKCVWKWSFVFYLFNCLQTRKWRRKKDGLCVGVCVGGCVSGWVRWEDRIHCANIYH